MGKADSQLAISYCLTKLPVLGLGYNQLSCWPNKLGCYQACRLLSTTSAYKEPSSLRLTIFGTRLFSALYQKRNINTKPSYKPFVYNGVDIKISNWCALPWRVCFFISQYSLVACLSFCRIEASCTILPSTLHVCWCHPSSASI